MLDYDALMRPQLAALADSRLRRVGLSSVAVTEIPVEQLLQLGREPLTEGSYEAR